MSLAILFWFSALLILYSYVGYPFLIFVRAWARPRWPRRRADFPAPTVSVIVVVHDEEDCIERKLRSLLDSDYPRDRLEILVVSDGSVDRTEDIVRGFANEGVSLLSLPGPRGKPASLNQAVPLTSGEILVLSDARQCIAPDAIRALIADFADSEIGAVSCGLHLSAREGTEKASGVSAYWRYEKLIRHRESLVDSSVGATGALYALRRELFRPIDPRTVLDDVAIPMDVVLSGYRVIFEPKAKAFDHIHGKAGREFQRKIRTLAGNLQLIRLKPELLSPRRNRILWQFVSHKLTRLLVPAALLLLFATSLPLASEGGAFYRAAAFAQSLGWALAGLGALAPTRWRAWRLLRIPYAFALLNLAAALAWVKFFGGNGRANWKSETTAALEKTHVGGT
jgi:glycosyltransferase involved in cell wall biosynthesis